MPLPWDAVAPRLRGASHVFVEPARISVTKRGRRTDLVLEGEVARSIAWHLENGAEPPRIGRNGPSVHFRSKIVL